MNNIIKEGITMEAIKKVIIKRFKGNDAAKYSEFSEKEPGDLAEMAS